MNILFLWQPIFTLDFTNTINKWGAYTKNHSKNARLKHFCSCFHSFSISIQLHQSTHLYHPRTIRVPNQNVHFAIFVARHKPIQTYFYESEKRSQKKKHLARCSFAACASQTNEYTYIVLSWWLNTKAEWAFCSISVSSLHNSTPRWNVGQQSICNNSEAFYFNEIVRWMVDFPMFHEFFIYNISFVVQSLS